MTKVNEELWKECGTRKDYEMKGSILDFNEELNVDYLGFSMDREVYLSEQEEKGLKVVEPVVNQLFIDVDTEEDYQEFIKRFDFLCQNTDCFPTFKVTPSHSGLPHRHIIVTGYFNNDMTDYMRVMLQFALNSDPMREFLTVIRLLRKEVKPIVFFEDDFQNMGDLIENAKK